MNILEVDNLHVSYGPVQALRGVDISVEKGNVVAILGANGAGKTTLLKAITGIVPPLQGDIRYDGESIVGESVERIAYKGITHVPEGRQIFSDLTVEENLRIGAFTMKADTLPLSRVNESLRADKKIMQQINSASENDPDIHLSKKQMIANNLARVHHFFPVLKERAEQTAATLSGGEMQMLAIGRALMSRPTLLVLDEPSLGLAPKIVENIFDIINELNALGISILIVEQNALMALRISNYAYALQTGRIFKEGPSDALQKDEELIAAYLGG